MNSRTTSEEYLRRLEGELAQARAAFENLPAVVWQTGPDLRIAAIHGAALARLGLDPRAAVGRTIAECLDVTEPDFAPLTASRKALAGESGNVLVTWRGRTLQVIIEPVRNSAGAIAGTRGLALEVPDTRRMQDALLISQARIAGIVNISEDSIISLDSSQAITLFNRGAEIMFGYSAGEVLGKPIDVLLPERFVHAHKHAVGQFSHSPDALRPMNARGPIFGRRKDGSEFPAEASISKFEVAGEIILNVRMRDITDRVRAEEQLRARARQQAALARLGQLALGGGEIRALMQDACDTVREALGVDLCSVFERQRDESLLLAGGAGWPEGVLGCQALSAEADEPCLRGQGILSGISTEIAGTGKPFGVLGAHSRERRDFTENDLNFLQAVANVLATAIGRKRTEDALRQSTETLQVVNQAAPVSIWVLDLEGNVTFWNPAAERTFGWTEQEVLQMPLPLVLEDEADAFAALLSRFRAGERVSGLEVRRKRRNGSVLEVSLWSAPLRDSMGVLQGTLVAAVDITERNRLEEQLRQSQKLESIGLLAGGVAHDFNNLLTGIMGNISLAADMLPGSNPATGMLENALAAADRAAELVRQLLAYSGKGRFIVQPVDLSAAVRELLPLLQTSIPKKVALRLELDDDLPAVESDPSQIQQLIMNLVINGAEAIGENAGAVTVRTRFVDPDVRLEVADTGCGIDAATRAQMFEPFFTTKFTGRGLGLAAVSGIVRAHKGDIAVESRPGAGSTFTITLPADPEQAALRKRPEAHAAPAERPTVLVVDDEDIVRRTAKAALERHGFNVMLAENGREAVDLYREHAGKIGVVLLDVSMPVMGGEEALRRMLEIRPEVRVVVSSGYNEAEAVRRFSREGVAAFVQKPYKAAQLADRVREIWGQSPQSPNSPAGR